MIVVSAKECKNVAFVLPEPHSLIIDTISKVWTETGRHERPTTTARTQRRTRARQSRKQQDCTGLQYYGH